MEKEFVPYDRALKLKELGYNKPSLGYFDDTGLLEIKVIRSSLFVEKVDDCCLAPTFSQAFRWFREKYFYLSYVCSPYKEYNEFYFRIRHIGDVINEGELENFESQVHKSYEEAELACLDKIIEIAKHNLNKNDENKN